MHAIRHGSALQVLRPGHRVIQRLEDTVRRRGEDAIRSAEKIIDELPTSERQEVSLPETLSTTENIGFLRDGEK